MSNLGWEKLYRHYTKTGIGERILNGKILPEFLFFIAKQFFPIKNALDIGCGKGNYLKTLLSLGFKVTGLDTSKTALILAKKTLGNKVKLISADMFTHNFPSNTYDFVYSIHSLHHGTRNDVKEVLGKIYNSLVPGGQIFITLPLTDTVLKWENFQKKKILGKRTFAPLSGPEKGLIHSYYTKSEVIQMFKKFRKVKVLDKTTNNSLIITGIK